MKFHLDVFVEFDGAMITVDVKRDEKSLGTVRVVANSTSSDMIARGRDAIAGMFLLAIDAAGEKEPT